MYKISPSPNGVERISSISCVGQIVYVIYTLLVYIYTLLVYIM